MRRLKRTLVALSDRQSASTIMVVCKDYIPQERNILSSYIQASGLLNIISFVVAFFFLLVYGKLIPVILSNKNSRKLARRSEQGYPPFQFLMNPPSISLLRQWSSGRIIAFQAIGRGSIPFWRIFLWLCLVVFFMHTGNRSGAGNASILQ